MSFQRVHQVSRQKTQIQKNTSQLAARTLPVQAQQDSDRFPTYMADSPMQGLEQAARLGHHFVNIPVNPPGIQASVAVQRKHVTDDQSMSDAERRPNRTGLPDHLKAGVENLSGMALDDVRVHYHSDRPAQLNALAYTQGPDIHVAPGQERHLAHEAWHIVQQAQGRVKPTMQLKDGVSVNDDQALEHEADVMGAKALAHEGWLYVAGPANVPYYPDGAPNLLQRRVIKHAVEADEEVDRSAMILGEDAKQQVVLWPEVDKMLSPETETFVGHSSGDKIDGVTPEALAQQILPKTESRQFYNLQIAACKTGGKVENAPSFAERLKNALASNNRAVRVTAPKAPLWIAGPRKYMQPTGLYMPMSKDEWKAIVNKDSLANLETNRSSNLVEAAKAAVRNWLDKPGNTASTVAEKLNTVIQSLNPKPNQLSKNPPKEQVLAYIDKCKNTTKNGRPKVNALLKEIITLCGATPPSPKEEMQPEIDLFKRAYQAVLDKYPDEFKSDESFEATVERWAIEANQPLMKMY